MKRVTAFMMSFLLVFGISACGGEALNSSTSSANSLSSSAPVSTSVEVSVNHSVPVSSSISEVDTSSQPETSAEKPDEMRAIWISFLDLQPILQNASETEAKAALSKMVQSTVDLPHYD